MAAAILLIASAALAPKPLRVLGLQLQATSGQTQENLASAESLIRANPGYDLYVLPELSSHGYDDNVLEIAATHAQDALDGEITTFFNRCAREVDAHICYGFLRRTANGPTICQAVSGPDGAVELLYDKMHLCNMGKCSEVGYGLQPGQAVGTFECGGLRVGVTVCYDLRFCELYRTLAWDQGCDLILHPSAFVRDATFPCYHPFVTTRAVENGVYVLSINYAGADFGDSIAVGPWVGPVPGLDEDLKVASLGIEEGVLPLIVDPDVLSKVRRAYPYRRNVHPSLRSEAVEV